MTATRLLISVLALLSVAAACNGTPSPTIVPIPPGATASSIPATTATPGPTSTPLARPTFPLTLTDDDGTAVVLAREPAKVITLTPGATEIAFAIGAGPEVVGVSQASDYPTEATKLPQVATFTGVEVEKVVGLAPDLVIAGGNAFNPAADIARLRALKIPVLILDGQDSHGVDGVLRDVRLVGAALGKAVEADRLATSMKSELDAIAAAAKPAGSPPSVFYETGYDTTTGTIYGVADNSFVAGMIGLAGGAPVTTGDPSVWNISLEKLVAADPEVIVLGDAAFGSTPDVVARRPGWATLTAVKDGSLRTVDDTVITRPGPRLAIGLRNLAQAIDPHLALPPASSAEPSSVPSGSAAP